jgi:hypothetical protein
MPSARVGEFSGPPVSLGFEKRDKPEAMNDGFIRMGEPQPFRSNGGNQIGPSLFYRILKQLGITEKEFERIQ